MVLIQRAVGGFVSIARDNTNRFGSRHSIGTCRWDEEGGCVVSMRN